MLKKIVERLRELTKERGWTPYRLAKESGINPNTVTPIIKKGRVPKLDTLIKLCEGLNVSMSEFFSFDADVTVHLSSAETDLVECYREIPEEEQQRLLGYVRGLARRKLG